MTVNVRRVVTGHDAGGKAIVIYDETSGNVVSRRSGQSATVLWQTSRFPSNNNEDGDAAMMPVSTVNANGSVFRIVEFEPGVAARVHRTNSIDYAVIISGEIDMEMDDAEIHLSAGNCLVQRGTIHNWINRGKVPCVIAFAIIAAEPALAGGKILEAMG